MYNLKLHTGESFALENQYEAFISKLTMGDTLHTRFLNHSEQQAFDVEQEFLRLDSEDIRFRAYDLLFACYPKLRRKLPKDRYSHPDIIALLYNNSAEVVDGITAAKILINHLQPKTERDLINCVSLLKHCILKALRDVLFDELTPELSRIYSRIIEQRMMQVLNGEKISTKNGGDNLGQHSEAS